MCFCIICGNQTMNTGFPGPTNTAKAAMRACIGQSAHFQLSADHAFFILSTTFPRLNSSILHLLGLSFLNILHCYYLSFSLCVYVLFIEITIEKRSKILLFSGGCQSTVWWQKPLHPSYFSHGGFQFLTTRYI